MRQKKSERQFVPHIIDIVDTFSNFRKWAKHRQDYYMEKKYPIKIYDVCYKTGVETPEIYFQEEIKYD